MPIVLRSHERDFSPPADCAHASAACLQFSHLPQLSVPPRAKPPSAPHTHHRHETPSAASSKVSISSEQGSGIALGAHSRGGSVEERAPTRPTKPRPGASYSIPRLLLRFRARRQSTTAAACVLGLRALLLRTPHRYLSLTAVSLPRFAQPSSWLSGGASPVKEAC